MKPVYLESAFLAYEDHYIKQENITIEALINHVGRALFQSMQSASLLDKDKRVLFVVGKGNNGKDALVIADAFLKEGGNPTLLLLETDPAYETYMKDVFAYAKQYEDLKREAINYDVYVDGLLGINCTYPLSEAYEKIIDWVNVQKGIKVSIDVPSGLKKESGIAYNKAIIANHTFVIQGLKLCNILQDAKDTQGKLHIVDCQLNPGDSVQIGKYESTFRVKEIKRLHHSHKYHYGHVGIIAGERMFRGATLLSTSASLHSGAGLVSLLQHGSETFHPRQPEPEVIIPPFDSFEDITSALLTKTSLVFGPGTSQLSESMKQWIIKASEHRIPMVLDAQACRAIAFLNHEDLSHVVITPHMKELADLLNLSVEEVKTAPIYALSLLPKSLHVILKGHVTIIKSQGSYTFMQAGNPGLAKAGTGDVLSGILGTLLSQMPIEEAIVRAVKWHSLAADYAMMKESMTCYTASSLIHALKKVLETSD